MPIRDIHPETPIASLEKGRFGKDQLACLFDADLVSALTGMSLSFIRKVLGIQRKRKHISLYEVLILLEQDAFAETFVPRSRIPNYLLGLYDPDDKRVIETINLDDDHIHLLGSAKELIKKLPKNTVSCIVTSTPYWGTRLYEDYHDDIWADGEVCPFGYEQTPEGFIRHTIEILYLLKSIMKTDGSIWWNLMDVYNTRTQIRVNAAETLRAMNGKDTRSWKDYKCRRYSAGHSYLKDGEKCLIPYKVAERASRIGYWVKSTIVWKKDGSMPEPVETRVTREVEYILHLSLQRSPYFDKMLYNTLPKHLGGRNPDAESEKITDIWCFPTALGTDGHGAQFPIALPARCIALSTQEGDLVLDPFIGSGTTSIAAALLKRRSIGIDVIQQYLDIAKRRLEKKLSYQESLPNFLSK